MTKHLTDEEFHEQALAGGASRSASTGHVPDRGYMVGGARDLGDQPYPEVKHPVDQFSLEHVRHHAREIRDKFGDNPRVYQGAWREDEHVVMDASENESLYHTAITKAKMRGERAIYDVRRNRDRYVKGAEPKN